MIRDKQNSEHYFWGANCQGWRLVDGPLLSIIEEEMPPHTAEKKHFHKEAQQLFYIKSGVATFEIEGKEYHCEANQSFYIMPGVVHQITNKCSESLKFIVTSQPSTKGDRYDV